jgi:hypothetical protein
MNWNGSGARPRSWFGFNKPAGRLQAGNRPSPGTHPDEGRTEPLERLGFAAGRRKGREKPRDAIQRYSKIQGSVARFQDTSSSGLKNRGIS